MRKAQNCDIRLIT